MFAVMLLGEGAVDLDQLQGRNPKPFRFKASQDRAHEAALNGIGLENNQSVLHEGFPAVEEQVSLTEVIASVGGSTRPRS